MNQMPEGWLSLADLEADPAYRQADASTQAGARAVWFQTHGVAMPEYALADNETRLQFEDAVMRRAPVLESDDPNALEWIRVADLAEQGDPAAIARAKQIHTENTVAEMGGLIGWLGTKLLGALGNKDFQDAETDVDRRDRGKAFEYFQAKTSQNTQVTDWTTTVADLGITAAGIISDVLLFRGAAGVLGKAVGAAGLASNTAVGRGAANLAAYFSDANRALVLQKMENLGPVPKFLLGEMVPAVTGAAGDAAALTASQAFRTQSVMDTWGTVSPTLQKDLAVVFGENVLMDIAVWSGLKALKPALLFTKLELSKIGQWDQPESALMENVDEFSQNIIRDPEMLAEFRKTNPEGFEAWYAMQNQAWQKQNGLSITNLRQDPAFVEAYAARAGYTIGPSSDGKLVNVFDRDLNKIGAFDSHSEAFDGLLDYLDQMEAASGLVKPSDILVKPEDMVQIESRLMATLNKQGRTPEILMTAQSFTPTATGTLDFTPFQAVNAKLASKGVKFVQIPESQFLRLTKNGLAKDADVLPVPATITKPETMARLESTTIPRFATQIESIKGPEFASLWQNLYKGTKEVIADKYSAQWLRQNASDAGYSISAEQGGLRMTRADGYSRLFKNERGAAIYLMQQKGLMSEADFRAQLRHNANLDLVRAEKIDAAGNPYTVLQVRQIGKLGEKVPTGGIVLEGKDVADILDQRPDLKFLLPTEAAPYINLVEFGKPGSVSVRGRVATGDVQTLQQLQANFATHGENTARTLIDEAIVRTVGDAQIAYKPHRSLFIARVPKYGLEVPAADFKSAQAVLDAAQKNFTDLQRVAQLKGVAVDLHQGHIFLRTVDDTAAGKPPVSVRSLDEAAAYIKGLPNQAYDGPELSQMFAHLEDVITEPHLKELLQVNAPKQADTIMHQHQLNKAIKWHKWAEKGTEAWKGLTGHIADGMDSQFRYLAEAKGDKRFYDIYQQMSVGHMRFKGKSNEIDHLMNGLTNGLSKKEREQMIHYLSTPVEEWSSLWAKLNPEKPQMPEKVLNRLNATRRLLDNHATIFGIDPWVVVRDYFPRLKDALKKESAEKGFNANASATEFVKRHMGDTLPTELKFFAENLRMSDMAEFLDSVTFDEVVTRYLNRGYKKLFLDDRYKEANRLFDELKAENKMTPAEMIRVHEFLDNAYGMAQTATQVQIEAATQEFSFKFRQFINKIKGGDNRQASVAHQDVIDFMKSFVVASTMAFRPGLVLRNLQQIYQTLSPVAGQDFVDAAMVSLSKKGIWKDLRNELNEARSKGHVMTSISPLGPLASNKGLLAKFNEFGMRWYKDSDAATRLICDETVRLMTDAPFKTLEASAKTADDFTRFLKNSRLNRLHPSQQQDIIETYQQFGQQSALVRAQDHMQQFTLFGYQQFDNPAVAKGAIGKLYGTFGHYPIHYLSMMNTMLGHPDKAIAASFAMNIAKTAAAFYLVGERVYGINSRNFMPWNQMIFTGGPYFDLLMQATTAIGSGPDANMARAQLPENLARVTTPFGMNIIGGQKALELFKKGDTYGGFMTLMSLPYATPPDRKLD